MYACIHIFTDIYANDEVRGLESKIIWRESIRFIMMIMNGVKEQNKQSSDLSAEEDSIELMIQPENKHLLRVAQYDCKFREDDRSLYMYIELDTKEIGEAIKESSRGRGFDDERKHIKNCIFLKKIETPSGYKGNFHITYLAYKGLSLNVYLQGPQLNSIVFFKTQLNFHQDNWRNKWISGTVETKDEDSHKSKTFKAEISTVDVEEVLKDQLLVCMIFQKDTQQCRQFTGLENSGNICYMNSILQVLFNFIPFRKLVMEHIIGDRMTRSKSGEDGRREVDHLIEELQEKFLQMVECNKRTINADCILNHFHEFNGWPRQQHDIHEFLIKFFDEIEKGIPLIKQYWSGKDYQVTYSKDPSKPYSSQQHNDFYEIELFMEDTKGVYHRSVEESLREALREEKLDVPIENDEHGRITAYKIRHFKELPNLLFLNIRRYKYNPKRRETIKLNLDMSYPQFLNLDFLMETPGVSLDYILYAVVVHKGRTPNQGHYFTFINVSKRIDERRWIEFNDSLVSEASIDKVLGNYTGKVRESIYLNEKYGKWDSRNQPSEETAYLLIYFRKQLFERHQNMHIELSPSIKQKLAQKLTEEEAKTKASVKIYVLRKGQDIDIFSPRLELIQLKLLKAESFQDQLAKFQKVLSCKIGSIWKVNRKTRKVKRIQKYYGSKSYMSVQRQAGFNKGMRQPDYFLIVSKELMPPEDDPNLGILQIREISEEDEVSRIQIRNKMEIQQALEALQKEGANLSMISKEPDEFYGGWTDLLCVIKE